MCCDFPCRMHDCNFYIVDIISVVRLKGDGKMNRKATTMFLTDLLEESLQDRKYYAKEVTLDYGTAHPKRVDLIQFIPAGVTCVSDIEKGKFICYEIKSCVNDVYSGNGLRFYGEQNYIVTTMETYKELMDDLREDKFWKYIKENYPESNNNVGIMVPIPTHINLKDAREIYEEFKNPTPLEADTSWKLYKIIPSIQSSRKRPMNELLFCMLRSKHRN